MTRVNLTRDNFSDLFPGLREEYDTFQKNLTAKIFELKQQPVQIEEYLQETAMPLRNTPSKRKASASIDDEQDSHAHTLELKRQKVSHHNNDSENNLEQTNSDNSVVLASEER